MGSASLILNPPPLGSFTYRRRIRFRSQPAVHHITTCCCTSPSSYSDHSVTSGKLGLLVSQVRNDVSIVSPVEKVENFPSTTGGVFDFRGATISLTHDFLPTTKTVTLVRHGFSTWNDESRVQGSSNLSVLTAIGAQQAEKCRDALADISFDRCFSNPISRAKIGDCNSNYLKPNLLLRIHQDPFKYHIYFPRQLLNLYGMEKNIHWSSLTR